MPSSTRKYALISGISLLAMALAAGYAYGFVYNSLVIPENPAVTFANIRSSPDAFMGGFIGWIVIFLLDILVAWGLYWFFKEIHPGISLVTAVLRVIYALVLGAAILHLFPVVAMAESTPAAAQVMNELKAFESLWSQGLILFGVHLFGLGILSVRSRYLPNLLGGLLLFAGLCYTGIHLAKAVAPMYLDQIVKIEMVLSLPMALAEIALAFWLILRGGKTNVVSLKHS